MWFLNFLVPINTDIDSNSKIDHFKQKWTTQAYSPGKYFTCGLINVKISDYLPEIEPHHQGMATTGDWHFAEIELELID